MTVDDGAAGGTVVRTPRRWLRVEGARLLELTTESAREVGAADLAVLLVRDPSGADRLFLKSVAPSRSGSSRRRTVSS
jgi:hypothetical protein